MTRFERLATVATVAISAGGLGIAGLQYYAPNSSAPAPTPVATQAPIPIQVTLAPTPTPAAPSRLSQILVGKTIGRQIDYVEKIIGLPTRIGLPTSTEKFRYYEVEGCNVQIKTDQENQISSLSLDVTPNCTFEWRDMMGNLRGDLPHPDQITFGQFFSGTESSNISAVSGCVHYCGNAAASELTMTRFGSHADDWISVRLGVTIDSKREVTASGRLSDAVMRTVSEEAADELSSVCDKRLPAMMLQYIGDLRVERIEFTNEPFYNSSSDNDCDLTAL